MYSPSVNVSIQYAELAEPKALLQCAKGGVDNSFFISFFEMVVSYAKDKYEGTPTLYSIEVFMKSLYGSYVDDINKTVQIIDAQPVLIDNKLLIIN